MVGPSSLGVGGFFISFLRKFILSFYIFVISFFHCKASCLYFFTIFIITKLKRPYFGRAFLFYIFE